MPVEIEAASRGSISRTVTLTGVVEPIRAVGVNAQITGALRAVRVEEGAQVRVGQVLAEIDALEIASQLRSAEATLALARSSSERADQLWRQGMITVPEYERERAGLATAQAQVEQLGTRLGYATVRSPIAGVVIEKRVEAGDVVGSLTRLFTVADVSTLVLRIPVSELEVAHLAVGDSVAIAVDARPGLGLHGRVRRVFPSVDSLTRQVPVEVALIGDNARLVMPGFLARVEFDLSDRDDALLVPIGALVGAATPDPAVFVVRNGAAYRSPVRPGTAARGRVEILEGLRAGDSVVIAGQVGLRDGAAVRVVPPVAPAPRAGQEPT
jgi:RND family efflux transporter MFP subunit